MHSHPPMVLSCLGCEWMCGVKAVADFSLKDFLSAGVEEANARVDNVTPQCVWHDEQILFFFFCSDYGCLVLRTKQIHLTSAFSKPLCISPVKTVNKEGRDEAGSVHPSSLHKVQFQIIRSFILKRPILKLAHLSLSIPQKVETEKWTYRIFYWTVKMRGGEQVVPEQ